jgi:hypothetical protein
MLALESLLALLRPSLLRLLPLLPVLSLLALEPLLALLTPSLLRLLSLLSEDSSIISADLGWKLRRVKRGRLIFKGSRAPAPASHLLDHDANAR